MNCAVTSTHTVSETDVYRSSPLRGFSANLSLSAEPVF